MYSEIYHDTNRKFITHNSAKIFLVVIGAIMFSSLTMYPAFAVGTPTTADLYYTTYNGGQNVWQVHATWDGTTFALGSSTNIASTDGADGIIFAPDGDLLVGGQAGHINKVHISPPSIVDEKATGSDQCFHLALDPSLSSVWCGGDYNGANPFKIGNNPLTPFAAGTGHTITGDDNAVDSIAFVGSTVYYTQSGPGGNGNFGTIDLSTFVTHRLISDVPAAHGMILDSFTGDLILCGSNQISQINPADPTKIVSTFTGSGSPYDQCASDGKGHLYSAANNGVLTFIDYSISKLVGTPDYSTSPFLANFLDDIAPIAGLGGGGQTPTAVGGSGIPIDSTALLLAGVQGSTLWMIPAILIVGAGIGIASFKRSKKKQTNSQN